MMRWTVFAAALLLAAAPNARAADQQPNADELAAKMLAHATFGHDGAEVTARMILVAKSGAKDQTKDKQVDERAFTGLSKRGDKTTKSVVRFSAPERVAGTALLVLEQDGAASQQYIYLPAYKKVRRVAARERDSSFLGSDFTYADLERRYLREGAHEITGAEQIDGIDCWVLQTTPAARTSPYQRVVTWLRKTDAVPLRVQFFAADGKLKKTTFTRRIKTVDGKPVVVETHTEDATSGHATDLIIDEVKFRTDLQDSDFNPDALARP